MQPGDTLAHYEIRSPLGKGGMGEVFLATDTKLNRDVALKILPEEFAADAERVARFRREAQVLASLNHPNIAAIYGLEEDRGHLILAMELAPGQDLSRILENGPLPLAEALRIARAVAEGMAEAHDKGIVHRDLKPANVAVDSDGPVKILDFGLARAFSGDEGLSGDPESISHSPTITAAMTQQGVILGTAAYMSPEQARGKTTGKQADIWAFGCLLFELLTARRIFDGPTVSDSVAAILKNEPPWQKLPAETPSSIRRLLRRCLEKDTQRRLRDIGDACLDIDEAGESPDELHLEISASAQSGRSVLLWPVVAGALAIAVAFLVWQGSGSNAQQTISPPPRIADLVQMTDQPGVQINPSLSPDGKSLAYTSWDDGDSDIFVQRVGGSNPINLTAGYDGADSGPAFSPDGEQIAFRSAREGGGIFVMGATGETPLRVAEGGFDPCWSPDGASLAYASEIVNDAYGRDSLANLSLVDLATGQARVLHEIDAVDPDWSPSGQRIVFWSHLATIQGQRDIYTIGVDGSDPVPVTLDSATDWSPRWSPDGRWIYFISDRGGSPDLWRIGIDEKTGQTTGIPIAVTAGMAIIAEVSISQVGSMALTSRSGSGEIYSQAFDPVREIFLGQRQTLVSSSHAFLQISMTADGSQITYRTTVPGEHIYIMAGDGSNRRRLIADEHRNRGPEISPAGDWIIFYSNRSGNYLIWAVRTDGTGLRQVTTPPAETNDPMWTPDGRIMALGQFPEAVLVEIHLPDGGLEALQAPAAVSRVENSSNQFLTAISPDGRYRAYVDMTRQARTFVQEVSSDQRIAVVVDGRPVATPGEIHWLDNERIVLWDNSNKRAVSWNVTTRTGNLIPGISEPSTMMFTDGGKRVVVNRVNQKSDIWLLTLEQ